MLNWIDLEGVGWLRFTELEADEKKKRGCANLQSSNFLELDRLLIIIHLRNYPNPNMSTP